VRHQENELVSNKLFNANATDFLTNMYGRMMKSSQTSDGSLRTSIIISIADHVGALDEVLQIIKNHGINMTRIESRPSKTADYDYDFFVELQADEHGKLPQLLEDLKPVVKTVKVVGSGQKGLISP
jgi:prephenate dehydratase